MLADTKSEPMGGFEIVEKRWKQGDASALNAGWRQSWQPMSRGTRA